MHGRDEIDFFSTPDDKSIFAGTGRVAREKMYHLSAIPRNVPPSDLYGHSFIH